MFSIFFAQNIYNNITLIPEIAYMHHVGIYIPIKNCSSWVAQGSTAMETRNPSFNLLKWLDFFPSQSCRLRSVLMAKNLFDTVHLHICMYVCMYVCMCVNNDHIIWRDKLTTVVKTKIP
jgi:hypothetical protein